MSGFADVDEFGLERRSADEESVDILLLGCNPKEGEMEKQSP